MMTWLTRGRLSVAALMVGLTAGCGLTDVNSPTVVEDGDLNTAEGANLLRGDALTKFSTAIAEAAYRTAMFTDEYFASQTSYYLPGTMPEEVLDRRDQIKLVSNYVGDAYTPLQALRRSSSVALQKLLQYASPARAGEVFALRAYASLHLAETFCPGFPLHRLDGLQVIVGDPMTTQQVMEAALADFDSAASLGADSARVLNFARIGRGRTLLDLGRWDEAATAVADVPTDYEWNARFDPAIGLYNPFASFITNSVELAASVAEADGGNGVDFVSANDPRLVLDSLGLASDSTSTVYEATKYHELDAAIKVATGIEARLIEAEAGLANGGGQWVGILNGLRDDYAPAPMSTLIDPVDPAARLRMLFRERAFWLFGTAHRLGDLRRLVARHGQSAESVYPAGTYRWGGTFGTATSLPFPVAGEAAVNPAVTGCTGS